MLVYNEHSGVEVTAEFKSLAAPVNPGTVHWRLNCETTKKLLQDWTEVIADVETSVGGVVTSSTARIAVDGSLNVIQSDKNKMEKKVMLVVAAKDLPGEYSQTYEYYIRNLQGR